MAVTRRPWTRDELLVAFNLYCRTPFGRMHRQNPDIVALSSALGRSPSSVAMKLCNFASLDPAHRARGIKGLTGASRADAAIVEEFSRNWPALAVESEDARARLSFRPVAGDDEYADGGAGRLGATEHQRTVMARRLQGFFRATVLASYDTTCAISGICIPELLVASHIVPWSHDAARRLDPRNGIALSALHDRAFDRGLISFDHDLTVLVSPRLRVGKPTPVHHAALLSIEGLPLRLPSRFRPDPAAIEWHRRHVFAA